MRLLLLLLAFLTFLKIAPADKTKTKEKQVSKGSRLVGGIEAPAFGHPYMVTFMIGESFMGEGIIVDPYTILTDGKSGRLPNKEFDEAQRKALLVVAGKFAPSKYEAEEQWREVCTYVKHPSYDDNKRFFSYAVISLYEPFTINEYVNFIPLAPPGFEPVWPCRVVSRGSEGESDYSQRAKSLKEVVVESSECEEKHETLLCTNRAQCYFDDGAALLCPDGSRTVLMGVLTFLNDKPCAERTTSIYASVPSLPRSWIKQEVANAKKICRPKYF